DQWQRVEEGTPQGATASPLLANVFLHYVFDLWFAQWRRRHAHGDVIAVRYADDFIVGFQYRSDAEVFRRALKQRLARFGLELQPDKTRLIQFGRFAREGRADYSEGKPKTFDFLGLTHICGRTRSGKFMLLRHTVRKRLRAKLGEIEEALMK